MKEVYFFWKMLLETECTCEHGVGLVCLGWGEILWFTWKLLKDREHIPQAVCPGMAALQGAALVFPFLGVPVLVPWLADLYVRV